MKITRETFVEILGGEQYVLENEPLSNHTTFKTGGPADFLLLPQGDEGFFQAMKVIWENNLPYFIMGRGSNLLASDEGFRGVIMKIAYGKVEAKGNLLIADAGASLRALAITASNHSLAGMEFAAGIPGSIGGGVVMNAGAYDSELKDFVTRVFALDKFGNVLEMDNAEMNFSYRHSAAIDEDLIILGADFLLQPGDKYQIMLQMAELAHRRRDKQPLDTPSAGSTFKRPEGNYAGALIEQCGLKGCTLGGAQVSGKHAGFIVNIGEATSSDIYRLMQQVRHQVREETGILLEPEVKLLGDFKD